MIGNGLNGTGSAADAASPWQPLIDVSCEPLACEVGILIAREQLRIRDVIGQGHSPAVLSVVALPFYWR